MAGKPRTSDVIIAILDTGVDGAHPDLSAKLVPGSNTYDNNADTSDVYGHGTAVAGSAAALTNNGLGVVSLAWGCRLMPMRISDTSGMGYGSTIAKALTWTADYGARVANMSYRMDFSSTVTSAAQYFMSKGGMVIMSAGNASTFYSSADNPYILTVSATDSTDSPASWSNTDNNIDVAAPGVSVYTTNRGGGYGSWSGTSFSAPIVAGVAALVISANPSLSAQQVQDILTQFVDDRRLAGWDPSFGWGRVNAARAVSTALSSGGVTDNIPPTVAFLSPADGSMVSGSIGVQIGANDNAAVASVTLCLDGTSAATLPAAPYAFTWNTLSAANGSHTLQAVATDTSRHTTAALITIMINNAFDTTAPTMTITSLVDGTVVGRTVSVAVKAADDTKVVIISLYVDGRLTATMTRPPFTTSWNPRKAAGAHTLACRAYDAAGNVSVSQTVMVYR